MLYVMFYKIFLFFFLHESVASKITYRHALPSGGKEVREYFDEAHNQDYIVLTLLAPATG